MTIWILALLLLGALASAGYSQGAIRVAFSLVGIFAGVLFAAPLAPLVMLVLPFIGIERDWTKQIVGTIVAFYLVGVVFKLAAAFVHRKVEYHYKYRVPDAIRALWERMNRRTGMCLGLINGWVYFLLTCLVISTLGYFTTQIGGSESSSYLMKAVTKMAEDLRSTGMDKAVGGLNPAPERYYEIADALGFVANNRAVVRRIGSYPPFAVLAKTPVFQGMGTDREYLRLVESERDPSAILSHARTQEVITNSAVMTELLAVDLKDLTNYLATGKSAKYDLDRILGTWVYDFPASLKLAKAQEPDLRTTRMMQLRKELTDRYERAVFTATLDNRAAVTLPANIEGTAGPNLTNEHRLSFSGTWRKSGNNYQLSMTPANRNNRPVGSENITVNTEATIEKQKFARAGRPSVDVETIRFKIRENPVVFNKIPE
ncbi:MAG: CvpA family protein [Verrucomicrobia bacterium]|nr:CvpA family protein [Verrucomicrobiota bacterium]